MTNRFRVHAAALVLATVTAAAAPSLAAPPKDTRVALERRLRVADAGTATRRARLDQARLRATREPATSPRPASMRITIDPATGQPVSANADLMRDLEAMFARDEAAAAAEPVRVEHRPDGSDVAYVGERFMEHAIVQIDADGTRRLSCATTAELLRRAAVPASDSCPPVKE
jgi:type II secretory pathway pseudopilin PulG